MPAQITTLSNIVSIEAGFYHSLFIESYGTAWACGDNLEGALGVGSITESRVPVAVTGACSNSGIEDNATGNHLLLYPNPAHEIIRIETPNAETAQVNIYDVAGILLIQTQPLEKSIDVSRLHPGVYVLEIINNFVSIKRRWVKM